MGQFEDLQALIQRGQAAMADLRGDVAGLKSEIVSLKDQILNSGLTKEQEAIVTTGFENLITQAEGLAAETPATTNNPEPQPEPQPEPEPTEEPEPEEDDDEDDEEDAPAPDQA